MTVKNIQNLFQKLGHVHQSLDYGNGVTGQFEILNSNWISVLEILNKIIFGHYILLLDKSQLGLWDELR